MGGDLTYDRPCGRRASLRSLSFGGQTQNNKKARQEVRLPPLRGRNLPHVVAHGRLPITAKGFAHRAPPITAVAVLTTLNVKH